MHLIIYGDFNCPFSALASARADRLVRDGRATIEWRAVQHDTSMPADGKRLDDDARRELSEEVDHVRGLMLRGEDVTLNIPDVRPNTAVASSIFSTQEGDEAHFWRRAAFALVWSDGRNISDASALGELGEPGPRDERTDAWQQEWEAVPDRAVPLLVVSDDRHIGVEALKHLATLADG